MSSDGINWEIFHNQVIYRANTIFSTDDDVYIRVRYTGYSNTNIIYNGTQSFNNKTAVNYNTTYITSGNIVVGFVRYYKIPVSAFTGGYSLKVLGFSVNAGQQIWSNTVSFSVE
ncbi:hypothetical protein ACIQVU_15295 [Lysinibacillus sp. NPDC098008]|uniref:hypothetical protein n=1 Tax=Lysinibacillus sp. NPDC098008 TaxID=3364146 RepID=UPI00382E3F41